MREPTERVALLIRLTYLGVPIDNPKGETIEALRLAVQVAERFHKPPAPCLKCAGLRRDLEIAKIKEQGAVAASLRYRQERDQVQARYDAFVRNAVEIAQRHVPTPILIIQKEGPADGNRI